MAEEHGVQLLMRLGKPHAYVVYHAGDGSFSASWAVIERDAAQAGGVGAARGRRRTTVKKSFTCMVWGTSTEHFTGAFLLCGYPSGLFYGWAYW